MLAIRNLARNKLRTTLSIMGVALSVISIILLASIGNGLLTTGGKILDQSSIHLWVTGTASDLQSQYMGTGESRISDTHTMVLELKKNNEINLATPMLTEMVYAFKNDSDPKAIFALGLEGTGGSMVTISQGKDLTSDVHYNKGRYDGKWKREVLIDTRTASLLNVKVGDTIHIGKTVTEANAQTFKIIGLTNSLSKFSSNPMVIMYLSELQDITGNQYYDSVTMIIIRLNNPARAEDIQKELQQKYPQYTVSTNQEYLKKALKENSLPLASAGSIVVLAVIMGTMLAINTMLLGLNEKKKEIAILSVIGLSRWSIFKSIGTEGLVVSLLGGALGILVSIPLTVFLNRLIYAYMGFEGLVILEIGYLYAGIAIAVFIGLLTSFLAAIQISRMNTAELLRGV
ncbi:MAG: ABC transporter permease [Candidatus Methanoperedens sp.]